jgi:hypothetical protein
MKQNTPKEYIEIEPAFSTQFSTPDAYDQILERMRESGLVPRSQDGTINDNEEMKIPRRKIFSQSEPEHSVPGYSFMMASYGSPVFYRPGHLHNLSRINEEINSSHLGDRSCIYNAKSPYLQCTVAPEGDCATCPHYEKDDKQ